MTICGIDPGQKGALAFCNIDSDHSPSWSLYAMPLIGGAKDRQLDFARLKELFQIEHRPHLVLIERSPGYASRDKTAEQLRGYFHNLMKLVAQIHDLRGLCVAWGIASRFVRPQDWKRKILKGMNIQDKKSALSYVQQRWPEVELTGSKELRLAKAEAICITEYGLGIIGGWKYETMRTMQ
jgi:hypothetical protein